MGQITINWYHPEGTGLAAITAGERVMLIEHHMQDGYRDTRTYNIVRSEDGIGGNMDPTVKMFHGLRGTTGNMHTHAHGLREVLAVKSLGNRHYSVTVGPDLHPDWD